ncbi:YeiH family protein [Brachybacterium sacelli]|uniref:Integral membrane protein (TIGR00698 family) n=1 Tax=Brachybacterium sacelli TaxID=173364 RepID=A0ABS4X6E4_9MICO|nr:putative sulfate exporter family transporter [Brachybacterium sacelli]MBP2384034.1 putative integral membrane protein (TIGR00698 family) [Brachybacterium sacelli]
MAQTLTTAAPPARRTLAPGLLLCLAVAVAAQLVAPFLPGVSALILAIVAGIVVANTVQLPSSVTAGKVFSAKKLLRAGIVLLGLQLVLGDILALGVPMLLVVAAIVAGGILGTVALGRLLGVAPRLSLLIACGFSICGAAAVAAAAGVTDPEDEHEEDTVTAVALVVLCGTAMIALLPAASALLGLAPGTAGLWAGGSIHEIAQVVAAGGVLGGGALAVAVVVKLARILMLAPVMAVLSTRERRRGGAEGARPPLVPLFVLGFLAMVLMRSFLPLPDLVVDAGAVLQTTLLGAAMFALGTGVRLRALLRVGARPFALATASTLLVAALALLGVLLVA